MKATWQKLTLSSLFMCTFLLAQSNAFKNYSDLPHGFSNPSPQLTFNTLSPLDYKVSYVLGEMWASNAWTPSSNRTYSYNSAGYVSEEISQTYFNGWQNSMRMVYVYDNNNRATLITNYDWENGAWVNSSKVEIVYTANTSVQTSYNWVNGSWEYNQLVTMTFTNNVTTNTLVKKWENGAWVNQYQYSYNVVQGIVNSLLMQIWQNNAWVNVSTSTYTYSNNLLSVLLSQIWQNGVWVNSMRSTYTYDNNGNNTLLLNEAWLSGQWSSSSRTTSTFSNNLKQTEIGETWSFVTASWLNTYRYTYTYANVTSIDENKMPAEFSVSQNYPNPFNPTTTIKYSIPSESFVCLKVYDMVGREVGLLVNEEKMPGNYEVKFDASQFSSGVYFYTIQAGTFIQTKKMVLVK